MIVAQTQGRSRTARQPSRSSVSTDPDTCSPPRSRVRTFDSSTAEIRNVNASSPNAAAPPTLKISAVAMAGLMKDASSRLTPPRACADWISCSGKVCGTRPVYAGWKNACAVP